MNIYEKYIAITDTHEWCGDLVMLEGVLKQDIGPVKCGTHCVLCAFPEKCTFEIQSTEGLSLYTGTFSITLE